MKRILLIEDDAWQAETAKRQLIGSGFAVRIATDALMAFAMIDKKRPDAIVLDVMLPGPNGIAFLHELQSHTDLADVPVVVCSMQQLDIAALRPYGVLGVLDKTTMQPDDIAIAVRKVVS